jgi:hypothetical protein
LLQAFREFLGRQHAVQIARSAACNSHSGCRSTASERNLLYENVVIRQRSAAGELVMRLNAAGLPGAAAPGNAAPRRDRARPPVTTESGPDAFGNAATQARDIFARAGRIAKFNRFQQTLHGNQADGAPTPIDIIAA